MPAGFLLLDVPLAGLAPAEADRSAGPRRSRRWSRRRRPSSIPDCSLRPAPSSKSRRPQETIRHELPSRLANKLHQVRHVAVLAHVVAEILHLPVDVIFLQDHVPHRHGEGRIRALLHRQPDVAELGRFRIVRADHRALGAAIACLRVEMGVGRARLRDVRAPQDDEAGIVPVGDSRERRSARPRSAARPAADRNTNRRTTCRRRRAATDSASPRRKRPSTSPGSARNRSRDRGRMSWRCRRWRRR